MKGGGDGSGRQAGNTGGGGGEGTTRKGRGVKELGERREDITGKGVDGREGVQTRRGNGKEREEEMGKKSE